MHAGSYPDRRKNKSSANSMVGKIVSHYRIVDELGEGGMGVVYRAVDTRLDRTVALKFLPRQMTRDRVARTRFEHEAKAASALDHENICTIYDIGEDDEGRMFIAMAYYEGRSLRDYITDETLSIESALGFAIQIAEGLAAAHARDIVHRDIKPANVMITPEGQPKIVDFGLAKVAGATVVTEQGSTLGTALYMSPEQARGEEVDARTDQWSLGVVLYEMLTGEKAFRGDYSPAIIYSVLNEQAAEARTVNPEIPVELEMIVQRMMEKDPRNRFPSIADVLTELKTVLYGGRGTQGETSTLGEKRLVRIIAPAVAAILILAAGFLWYVGRQENRRIAGEQLLSQIDLLLESTWSDYTHVYDLARQAAEFLPDDDRVLAIIDKSTRDINVSTDPPGAAVYMKPYATPDAEWEMLGTTPIEKERVPVGIFRWKFEKEGYETVLAAATSWALDITIEGLVIGRTLSRTLDKLDELPIGMVRVAGVQTPEGLAIDDFFIGWREVTNAEYQQFITNGGYRQKEYWTHPILDDDRELSWEDAMALFVDQTDRPGPSTWQAGAFPEDESDYPVSGVSWYEAAAYAEWAGVSLPTGTHWGRARGENTLLIRFPQLGGYATFAPFSNMGTDGAVRTASLPGYTAFGAYDMAGNVREWCWNEFGPGRLIRGGAWSDNTYKFSLLGQAPALDRSIQNGFRVAVYPEGTNFNDSVFNPTPIPPGPDLAIVNPVSDEIFEIYRQQFSYDKTPLNTVVLSTDESPANWVHEKVRYDAAYGGEEIIAHLFLPRNVDPPYQTVVYFPGSASLLHPSSEEIETYYEFTIFLSFLVRNGRAVVYPVYQGTFERQHPRYLPMHLGSESFAYTEFAIQLAKDFRRTIDYLETRDDIDADRIAYYGMSWGGIHGAIITAVEDRLKASILMPGIYTGRGRPEIHQANYIPRITVPTLLLSGEYDAIAPLDQAIIPFFNMLGTPEEDKLLKTYPTDHIPPMNEVIRETLAWLDRYLGPVR